MELSKQFKEICIYFLLFVLGFILYREYGNQLVEGYDEIKINYPPIPGASICPKNLSKFISKLHNPDKWKSECSKSLKFDDNGTILGTCLDNNNYYDISNKNCYGETINTSGTSDGSMAWCSYDPTSDVFEFNQGSKNFYDNAEPTSFIVSGALVKYNDDHTGTTKTINLDGKYSKTNASSCNGMPVYQKDEAVHGTTGTAVKPFLLMYYDLTLENNFIYPAIVSEDTSCSGFGPILDEKGIMIKYAGRDNNSDDTSRPMEGAGGWNGGWDSVTVGPGLPEMKVLPQYD